MFAVITLIYRPSSHQASVHDQEEEERSVAKQQLRVRWGLETEEEEEDASDHFKYIFLLYIVYGSDYIPPKKDRLLVFDLLHY